MNANVVATWTTIISVILGGGIWVGSIASETANNKETISAVQAQTNKLRDEGPPAIARLEAQVGALQNDVRDVKSTQKEILDEVRKK